MNKTLLRQALEFYNNNPTHSQIENLYKVAFDYQRENNCIFLKSKRGQKASILDEDLFFIFISEEILENSKKISTFREIENILKATTREDNIEASGDSKNSIVKVFNKIVVHQLENNNPIIYKHSGDIKTNGKILAVENGETFLNIHSIMSKFGYSEFVYLAGFSNLATQKFLKDKDVVFFLDYDIEAIRIYDSFKCKTKEFFKHPDIERYFKIYGNKKLYLHQRKSLPTSHKELKWLLELIRNNNVVVEQEIIK